MKRHLLTEKDLKRELRTYQEQHPSLKDDELFVLWFLRAYLTDNPRSALGALCGGSSDKGFDAILVDDKVRVVCVVQGKYREKIGKKNELRADVLTFARLAEVVGSKDDSHFSKYAGDLKGSELAARIAEARQGVVERGYRLRLYYVTTGKVSKDLREDATRASAGAAEGAALEVIDGRRVLLLLTDYLDGVAPPIPSLELEMAMGQGVQVTGLHQRVDHGTKIVSWVFSMNSDAIADLYDQTGLRLFARNIRGFLGNTAINKGMQATLGKDPEYFWYYNNGITIICDGAESIDRGGSSVLRVMNPQVINGQQTTRVLHAAAKKQSVASVLVRVIQVPRDQKMGGDGRFESLVSKIVAATNWQNAIKPSDLMSNDRRQIEIERQLRKLGYQYLRKRETKSEARRRTGAKGRFLIKKEELAQAVAACDLDPLVLRLGKERLFEEENYSTIFPTSDPYYYLSRYWLMREVTLAARGYPERAYAKWLVLNFVWKQLKPRLKKRSRMEWFRRASERREQDSLAWAIDPVFKGALRFYRINRGRGAKAKDVSTFFKQKGLHKQFNEFWYSDDNPKAYESFELRWAEFEQEISEA